MPPIYTFNVEGYDSPLTFRELLAYAEEEAVEALHAGAAPYIRQWPVTRNTPEGVRPLTGSMLAALGSVFVAAYSHHRAAVEQSRAAQP